MGDHLTLLVDHLLTESTFQAATRDGKQGQVATDSISSVDAGKEITQKRNFRETTSVEMLAECRICREEDEDYNMEIPCSCCGSLKFAHRKCVQRWCDEKGDTVCEICLQQFKPGYTAPPNLFQHGSTPMNFRGNWAVTRQNWPGSQSITLVPSERDNIHLPYPDSLARSTDCCQSVAVIFLVLLFLRHTLPLMIAGAEQYSFTLFSLMVLRTIGILLPVFLMIRTIRAFHRRRIRLGTHQIFGPAEGENAVSSS
ncbi:hypothetical protein Cni_G11582 [Canna indica]|uniref:RING-CH-type domain-containing protein n=1 Tax=Canna indica TaxID=4628 RepID=A0AAQ3QBD0_9LILI|nr:hypothetical protein Cni_G11582 [Canna indica]